MQDKYQELFNAVQFKSGLTMGNRFAMSPMVIDGSTEDGHVTEEDLAYFGRRAHSASLLITGATSVSKDTNAFGYGLANADESYLPGLTKLAQKMKSSGNLAMMQLFHPGREAAASAQAGKPAYGPSDAKFSFMDYPTTGLSESQVEEVIEDFGQATLRAIQAGFDGVEIHGANHYLLQQFFSTTSNLRTDQWGGSLEKRAAFPVAVLAKVKQVVAENANRPFIIGYRISPEEINGETVGYTLDDALFLIDQIVASGVDYVHVSQFGPNGFQNKAQLGNHQGEVIAQVIKEHLNSATKLVLAGDLTSAEKVLAASQVADVLALASALIVDPAFVEKIAEDKAAEISLDASGRFGDLQLPKNFYLMKQALLSNQAIPAATLNEIKA